MTSQFKLPSSATRVVRLALAVLMIAPGTGGPASAQLDTRYIRCRAGVVRVLPVAQNPLVYGLWIRNEGASARAVRIVVNTVNRTYAVTFGDLPFLPTAGTPRYIMLGERTAIESAWVDRAGSAVSSMTGCSRPVPDHDAQTVAKRDADAAEALRSAFSSSVHAVAATDLSDVRPLERCYDPTNAARRVLRSAADVPKDLFGRAVIRVELNAQDQPTAINVSESSGQPELDRAVLEAAWKSGFLTESIDCRPRPSSFIYVEQYSPPETRAKQ